MPSVPAKRTGLLPISGLQLRNTCYKNTAYYGLESDGFFNRLKDPEITGDTYVAHIERVTSSRRGARGAHMKSVGYL